MQWLIYGANGYTGTRLAEAATARGERPILAGRSARAILPLAERLGCEARVFSLDAPGDVAARLGGVQLVLGCAGPFARTAPALVEACLVRGVHYLDLAGEIGAIEATYARDVEAKERGCVLMPAVGFSTVPLDCLAVRLCAELPGATRLELAFEGYDPSGGTVSTYVAELARGGAVRSDGALVRVPLRWEPRRVAFRSGTATAVRVPYGDLASVYRSTGVPDIEVFLVPTRKLYPLLRFGLPFTPLLRVGWVARLATTMAQRLFTGPSAAARARRETQLWGRATDAEGREVVATARTGEPYAFTVECALEVLRRFERELPPPGATTAGVVFGWRLLDVLGGDVRIESDSGSSVPPAR